MPGVWRPPFSWATLRTARSLADHDDARRRCNDSTRCWSPRTLAMKMRCWRRRTSFSTWRQLIWFQSRVGLAPFASVSCPTVNTPFANVLRFPQAPSLHRQWWNSALSADSRELPPYPERYPGPWLGPLSSVAALVPVGSPLIVEPVGISTG